MRGWLWCPKVVMLLKFWFQRDFKRSDREGFGFFAGAGYTESARFSVRLNFPG